MRKIFLAFSLFVFVVSCSNKKQYAPQDTLTSGSIRISAEESFKPILEEEIKKRQLNIRVVNVKNVGIINQFPHYNFTI